MPDAASKKSESTIVNMNCTIFVCVLLLWHASMHAQAWPTIGGNNQKNGRSEITGPQSLTEYWSVTSPNNTLWGNSVFTVGDMFVQARVVFTPSYTSEVELRSLQTGGLIWEQQVDPAAILYAVGFTEDAVYATDQTCNRACGHVEEKPKKRPMREAKVDDPFAVSVFD